MMTIRPLAIAALRMAGAPHAAPARRPATQPAPSYKLSGWHERRYPVRITLNDCEAFTANTPKELAYVTLPRKPVHRARGVPSLVEAKYYETPRNP
ncbi:MAG TPA: hypothetical protein VGF27_12235 [Pseudoduganella sp.]